MAVERGWALKFALMGLRPFSPKQVSAQNDRRNLPKTGNFVAFRFPAKPVFPRNPTARAAPGSSAPTRCFASKGKGHVTLTTAPTTVHNLRHEQMRPGDIRIDRRTELGNEFIIGRDGSRDEVIAKFETAERARLADPGPRGAARRAKVRKIAGRRIFCWCSPLPCHGHVYARLAAELVITTD